MGNYFEEEEVIEEEKNFLPPNCLQLYDSKISITNLIILDDKQTMIVSSDCQIKYFDIVRKRYEGNSIISNFVTKLIPYDNRKFILSTDHSVILSFF